MNVIILVLTLVAGPLESAPGRIIINELASVHGYVVV